MSATSRNDDTTKKPRTPVVRSVEAVRWASLKDKMTPQERRHALLEVAAKMR